MVRFKFFSKPMSNNLLIQYGTCLSKNTIFRSLRQDMVRRMVHCSQDLPWEERVNIVEDYIQLLVNSKHSFPFIKAVISQGLTKYKSKVDRSRLPVDHSRYMPLYRGREFNKTSRILLKYIEPYIWYKNVNLGDKYQNLWKLRLEKNCRNLAKKKNV